MNRPDSKFVTASFVAGRGLLFLFIAALRLTLPERAINPHKSPGEGFPHNAFLDSFVRWDSNFYYEIAQTGYAGRAAKAAFFPAFPYLSHGLGSLLQNDYIAGLLLSNLSLWGGLYFLYGIAQIYGGHGLARRAVLFALIYPASFFFSAYYSEALFFFACTGALFFYERDQLLRASLFASLASATRPPGILLCAALFLGYLHRNGWRAGALAKKKTLALGVAPLGFFLVLWMMRSAYQDPLAFVRVQANWGRSPMFFLETLARETSNLTHASYTGIHDHPIYWLDLFASLGLFAAAAWGVTRVDSAHVAFALFAVIIPLGSGKIMSMNRFSTGVPLWFIFLANLCSKQQIERWATVAMVLGLALQTTLFVSWYWAG